LAESSYSDREAMGDVPGICELPLTRAVVQYRDVHEMDAPGGRIEDIGMALVVEGRYASSAEAVDLGSGKLKLLDLSTELVVLDWVYEPTLHHVGRLVTAAASGEEPGSLSQYTFRLGLRILDRVGFGPLTRPTFLRIGFRDICRDLDLNEGTSIRIILGPGRLTRLHLDYDAGALVFRTAFHQPDPVSDSDALSYQVRLPLPQSLAEARASLAVMRKGIGTLVARFEPSRYESLVRVLDTFGARETLAGLHDHEPRMHPVRLTRAAAASTAVH
jgi:hypothetical protein